MRKSVLSVRVLSVFLSLFLLTGMFYSFGVRDSVQAAAVNYSVSLTAAQPWARPIGDYSIIGSSTIPFTVLTAANRGACNYAVTVFRIDTNGVYTFDCTSNTASDPMFYLYSGSFDPVNATRTNFLIGVDDRAGNIRPYMSVPLTAGTTYYLVTTTFNVNATGTVNFTIDGPGTITITEPYVYNYSAGSGGNIAGTARQFVVPGESGTMVEAVPNTGYHFLSWSDSVPTAARTDANAAANLSVTANFEINSYSVAYTAGANGTVTGILNQTVAHGSDASTVEAVPSPGYHFVSWSDGLLTASRTDTVTGVLAVSASFERNTYAVNYDTDGNGTITGNSNQTVIEGENALSVEAVANTGYHFLNWSDGYATAIRTDLAVTADIDVSANFEINSYVVSYSAGANGSVTGDPDQIVAHGSDASTVEAVPSTGYHFVTWSDGLATASRTDTVTGVLTVSASFARNTYTAAYGTDGNGTITGDADQSILYGDDALEVAATPSVGYHFLSWSDGYATAIRTDLAVTDNIDVTANFEINSYSVDYSADANGSVTGALNQTVAHGSDASTVEAVPSTGYHFVTWSDGLLTASRTDTVTGALAVSASFARNTYTAAYGTDGNGTITGDADQSILYGDDALEVAATPTVGYHFLSWSDGYATAIRTDLAVDDNIDVTANFEINTYSAAYTAGSFGSLNGDTDQSITHGSDAASVEALPDTGYHFVRWSDDVLTPVRTDLALTGDLTVEAIFAIDLFDVSFQTQGGSIVSPAVVPYLTLAAAPDAPAMAGHTFEGWYKEAVCTHEWDFAADTVTADTILYAKWTINSYTVTFYDWDGSVLGVQLIRFGADAVAPAAPLRIGYAFVSWSEVFDNVSDNTRVEAVYRLLPTPTPTAVPTAVPTAGVLGAALTATPSPAAVLGAAKTGETNNQAGMMIGIVLLLGFGAVTTVYVIRRKKMKD